MKYVIHLVALFGLSTAFASEGRSNEKLSDHLKTLLERGNKSGKGFVILKVVQDGSEKFLVTVGTNRVMPIDVAVKNGALFESIKAIQLLFETSQAKGDVFAGNQSMFGEGGVEGIQVKEFTKQEISEIDHLK